MYSYNRVNEINTATLGANVVIFKIVPCVNRNESKLIISLDAYVCAQ